ncbi:hypothetical protein D9M73_144540 [compost metagenome]
MAFSTRPRGNTWNSAGTPTWVARLSITSCRMPWVGLPRSSCTMGMVQLSDITKRSGACAATPSRLINSNAPKASRINTPLKASKVQLSQIRRAHRMQFVPCSASISRFCFLRCDGFR